jgi:hypothetical protein
MMYLPSSVSVKHFHIQAYVREDDPLGQALLREGKALWELLRCPRFHAALLPPMTHGEVLSTSPAMCSISTAITGGR